MDGEDKTLEELDGLDRDNQMFYKGFLAGYEAGYSKCLENFDIIMQKLEKQLKKEEKKHEKN